MKLVWCVTVTNNDIGKLQEIYSNLPETVKPLYAIVAACINAKIETLSVFESFLEENNIKGCLYPSKWVDFKSNKEHLMILKDIWIEEDAMETESDVKDYEILLC